APQLNDDLAAVSLDDNLVAVSLDDDLAAVSFDDDLAAVSLDDDLATVSLDDELVVASYENNKKDDEYTNSQEKLYKGRIFQSWDEAYDTIKLYAWQKEFGLRKGHIEKTFDGATRKRTMLCKHKFLNDSELTQEMIKWVEFYMNVVKLKPLQIQRATQKEFPDRKIYFSEIHK
ncbi:2977_t:CDS:2, partial [Racocetra fulgida]